MDREHERGGDASQDKVGLFVVCPLTVGSSPAKGKQSVGHLAETSGRPVTQGGEVGNQAEIPEDERDGEIRGDGEHVPKQGAAEVLPDGVGVGDGEKEPGKPNPTHMEGGEDACTDHGKNRHGLGGAVDGGPPFLAGEKENGGDQSSGVTNADPENEVGDIPGPADGDI